MRSSPTAPAPQALTPAPSEPRSGVRRFLRSAWAIPVLVAVVALVVRLALVLRGGGLYGYMGYDDGVYYAAAAGLVFGRVPYRDFVLLHRDAARFIEEKYPQARVLTTWPASDELRNPYYGYIDRPASVVAVENFLKPSLEEAARRRDEYDVAFLFTTHGGPPLEEAARVLGARVVFREERKGQWVAVLEK